MPIYEFVCQTCNNEFELMRSFSDSTTPKCPVCSGQEVQRMLSRPAIHFKGSGWYITDSKSSNGKSGAKSDSDSKESDSTEKTSDKAETKSESKSDTGEKSSTETKSSDTKTSETKTPAATTTSSAKE